MLKLNFRSVLLLNNVGNFITAEMRPHNVVALFARYRDFHLELPL